MKCGWPPHARVVDLGLVAENGQLSTRLIFDVSISMYGNP